MTDDKSRSLTWRAWVSQASLGLLALLGLITLPIVAEAKTPGKTYCYNRICHYVNTIQETQRMVGRHTSVTASYYDDAKNDRFNPSNITSSGEYFRSWAPDNAASPVYPNGTKLVVWHPTTKKSVMVRINNSGPYYGNRLLDLSRAAAQRLGMTSSGVKTVKIAVVSAPTTAEAKYAKGRTYAPVKGYMGTYASLDSAVANATGKANSSPTKLAKPKPTSKTAAVSIIRTASLGPDLGSTRLTTRNLPRFTPVPVTLIASLPQRATLN
jgi:rare lipoprotein A